MTFVTVKAPTLSPTCGPLVTSAEAIAAIPSTIATVTPATLKARMLELLIAATACSGHRTRRQPSLWSALPRIGAESEHHSQRRGNTPRHGIPCDSKPIAATMPLATRRQARSGRGGGQPAGRHPTDRRNTPRKRRMATVAEPRKAAQPQIRQTQCFIGGQWVPAGSGKTFETINPATEEVDRRGGRGRRGRRRRWPCEPPARPSTTGPGRGWTPASAAG